MVCATHEYQTRCCLFACLPACCFYCHCCCCCCHFGLAFADIKFTLGDKNSETPTTTRTGTVKLNASRKWWRSEWRRVHRQKPKRTAKIEIKRDFRMCVRLLHGITIFSSSTFDSPCGVCVRCRALTTAAATTTATAVTTSRR